MGTAVLQDKRTKLVCRIVKIGPTNCPTFYRFHPSWVISLFQEATERLSVLESEALRLADCLAEWLVGKLLEIFSAATSWISVFGYGSRILPVVEP